jgi:hypothetical protein
MPPSKPSVRIVPSSSIEMSVILPGRRHAVALAGRAAHRT